MGPGTPSCKTKLATETDTRENNTIGGGSEAEQDTELMMDGDQTRKEVFTPTTVKTPNAKTYHQSWMLECKNFVAQVIPRRNSTNLLAQVIHERQFWKLVHPLVRQER